MSVRLEMTTVMRMHSALTRRGVSPACSCYPVYAGDGTECRVALTVVPQPAGILMFIASVLMFVAVVLMITAILCGSICVVQKLRKMEAEAKMDVETNMDGERFVIACASTLS